MGITNSRDTRRISFDNTFALTTPALVVQTAIEDEDSVLSLEPITSGKDEDILVAEQNKLLNSQDDGELDYWSRRIENLKKDHRAINKIIENEYEKTIENTIKLSETPEITPEQIKKIQPCFDLRAQVLRCYQENLRQPLVCAPVVQAFSQCVSSCRVEQ